MNNNEQLITPGINKIDNTNFTSKKYIKCGQCDHAQKFTLHKKIFISCTKVIGFIVPVDTQLEKCSHYK